MWERCGVVRDEAGLRDGLAQLDEIRAVVADVDVRPSAEGWSDLAQAHRPARRAPGRPRRRMRGALARRESRGCHNRTDYPELDPALQVNFHQRLDDDGRLVESVERARAAPIPDELLPWLEEAGPADLEGRLLE